MKYKLTDKLLLLLADLADWNMVSLSLTRSLAAIAGDPSYRRYHRWIEGYLNNKQRRQKLHQAIYNLKRRGYLQNRILGDKSQGYVITLKGQTKIVNLKIETIKSERLPAGQWLMVLFDIPEVKKKSRDLFRKELIKMRFEQLQKSVWVTPYKVKKELIEIVDLLGLKKFVKSLIVKELEK